MLSWQRNVIRITGVQLNATSAQGQTLEGRKKFSSKAQLASVLHTMGKLDGNVPSSWLPQTGKPGSSKRQKPGSSQKGR